MVKLSDIKNTSKSATTLIACRVPLDYKQFLKKNKIGLRELVIATIDELKLKQKRS